MRCACILASAEGHAHRDMENKRKSIEKETQVRECMICGFLSGSRYIEI